MRVNTGVLVLSVKNTNYLTPDDVKVHLYKRGFMNTYWYWTSHGKIEPHNHVNMHQSSSRMHIIHDDCNVVDRFQTRVEDLTLPQEEETSEPPNTTVQ